MALDRAAKKKIALKVGGEIKSVLGDENGKRLALKHKAKKAPPMPMADDEDMEAALGAKDDEGSEGLPLPPGSAPKKKTGFPFGSAGGGMRGRGLPKG